MVKQFYLTHRFDPRSNSNGIGCNSNEIVFQIPQSTRTEATPSDVLVSYSGHSLGVGSWSILQPQLTWLMLYLMLIIYNNLSLATQYEIFLTLTFSLIALIYRVNSIYLSIYLSILVGVILFIYLFLSLSIYLNDYSKHLW